MLASSLSSQHQEGNPSISSHLLATSTPFLSPLRQQQANRIHSPIFPSLSTSALTAPTSTTAQPSQNNNSVQQIGNNILILSHFCEKEGPSVLFSTQQIPIPIYSKNEQENKVVDDEQFDLQEEIGNDMEDNYPVTLQQKLDDLFQKNKSIIHRVEFSSVDVKYMSQPFSPSDTKVKLNQSNLTIFKSDEELERKKQVEENDLEEEDAHSSNSSDGQDNTDQQSVLHHFDEEDELACTIRDHVVHASQQQQQLPLFHIDSPLKLFEENSAEPIVYLSSHSVNSNYSAYLKSLCLRALSVEYIGPGKEGAVSFGDAQQGYHFVYVFKLKDCRARGFARWFAFILIHPLCMQNVTMCWNFLSQTLGKMVKQLKQKSQEIFNHEYSQVNKSHSSSTSVFNMNNTKKSSEPLRDLSSLLQNSFFFEQLHQFHCGVLKAFHEKLIPVTCKWNSKTKQIQYKYSASPLTKEEEEEEEWEQPECEEYAWKRIEFEEEEMRQHFENRLTQQHHDEESFASIRSLYQFTMLIRDYYFGYSKHKQQQQQTHPYHTLLEEGEDDDLLNQHPLSDTEDESHDDTASSVSSNSRTSRQSNLQNTKSTTKERKQKEELVNQAIRTLINNVILGNQLIIRSNHMDLANDICKLFIQLIPSTCVKASFGCKKYKPSYLANFITCFTDTFLPESHIDYSCSCLLDIRGNFQGFSQFTIRHDTPNTTTSNSSNNNTSSTNLNNASATSSTAFQYTQSIEEICFQNYFKHLPNHGSTLAQDKPSFYQNIEEKMLRHLKQEWISKAKLLIKFAKMKQHHGEMQQQQQLYQSIEKFCKIIKVKKSEIPVLQYFATGQWKRL